MKTLEIKADTENLETVQGFVIQEMEEAGCEDMKLTIALEIAIEEIFVNICHYAYEGEYSDPEKKSVIKCDITQDPRTVYIEFGDWGMPFDPLAKEDADITLSAEERGIGGLGILMVKKTMDTVDYKRQDDMNILSMTKAF